VNTRERLLNNDKYKYRTQISGYFEKSGFLLCLEERKDDGCKKKKATINLNYFLFQGFLPFRAKKAISFKQVLSTSYLEGKKQTT
jgi:hypothetical protein